jgi:hypothetical protein
MVFRLAFILLIGVIAVSCAPLNSSDLSSSACSLAYFAATPTANLEVGIAKGDAAAIGSSVAQQFLVTSAGTATTATVALMRTGTFATKAHTLTATIEANSNGVPSGVALATSNGIDVAIIGGTTLSSNTFTFQTGIALTASQVYWLRIKASYPVNTTNYISWAAKDGLPGYTNSTTGASLGAVVETAISNTFSASSIGTNRFMLFKIGC